MNNKNIVKPSFLISIVFFVFLLSGCETSYKGEQIIWNTKCKEINEKYKNMLSVAYENGVNNNPDLYMVEIRAKKSYENLKFNTIEINFSDDSENDTFFYLILSDHPRSDKFSHYADNSEYYYSVFFANKKKLDGTFCAQANYLYDTKEGIGVETYGALLKIAQ